MFMYFFFVFSFSGETYLRFEEEESRVGEVQVRVGLQDQRVEEADRTQGERHQGDERTNPRGNYYS